MVLVVIGGLTGGCFRDEPPQGFCSNPPCEAETSNPTGTTTAVSTSTTDATNASDATLPTSTTDDDSSTGTPPADVALTFRVDSMVFIDPHFFLVSGESCVTDATAILNDVLTKEIDETKFNMLFRADDPDDLRELRLLSGDCSEPLPPFGRRTCTPGDSAPALILNTDRLFEGECRDIDETVYAPQHIELLHNPQPPCIRTQRTNFSLPLSNSVGTLDLRNAQVVGELAEGQADRLDTGLLYGFLPRAAAENLDVDVPLHGPVNLWTAIAAPPCLDDFPELLPSIDYLLLNNEMVEGVWLALNITAERVDFVPTP